MYKIEYYTGTIWDTLSSANFEAASVIVSKNDNRIFYRKEIDGILKFYGGDFSVLRSKIYLQKLEARIKKKKDSTVVAEGYLNLLGQWDIDNSVCELSFVVVDDYIPVFKLWDEDVSLSTLLSTAANLEFNSSTKEITFLRSEYENPPLAMNNWVFYSSTSDLWIYRKQLIFFKASGWNRDWDLPGPPAPWIKYPEGFSKKETETQIVLRPFHYFYKLKDILNILACNSGCDFAPGDFSPYLEADIELRFILIAHKKNIISPGEVVKDKNMSLSGMLKVMKAMFNLDWYLDGGILRFKHPSEISCTLPNLTTYPAHDLTTFKGVNWALQKIVYTYSDQPPFKEKWNVEKSMNVDFDGLPIRYNVETDQIIEYDLSKFQSNFGAILDIVNGHDPGDISDKGWAVVAVDYVNKIISKAGILSGKTLINGKLALSRLHNDHFKTGGRYFSFGEMNGSAETFTNVKRKREMVELSIPAKIEDFEFDYLVKLSIGNCEIVSVSEPCNGEYSTIKLLY